MFVPEQENTNCYDNILDSLGLRRHHLPGDTVFLVRRSRRRVSLFVKHGAVGIYRTCPNGYHGGQPLVEVDKSHARSKNPPLDPGNTGSVVWPFYLARDHHQTEVELRI